MNLAFLIGNARPQRSTPGEGRGGKGEDQLVYALKNPPAIDEAQKPELADLVTRIMKGAGSETVRNAAAILLTDLIGRGATGSIADLVRLPGMPKSAGSLLFALNDVEACLPLDLLVDVIELGSLEAQGEALTFLEDGRIDDCTARDVEQAKTKLRSLSSNSAQKADQDAVLMALEYIDGFAHKAKLEPAEAKI